MIVGEVPGDEEDLVGEPFAGRDGVHLRNLIARAGIEKSDCFFTNAVKCKGKAEDSHINTCRTWLWAEIKQVSPKVVVTLGKIPTRLLLGLKKSFKLKDVVGDFRQVAYMPAVVAPWYHPSFLLQRGKQTDIDTIHFFLSVREKALELAQATGGLSANPEGSVR